MSYGMDGWNHDNDLVRRKDVMDSMVKEYNRRYSLGERNGLHLAWIEKAVNDVPSAQPTQNTRVNSNNSLDTISREAAINALGEEPLVWHDGEGEIAEREQWRHDVAAIKALPSAQPERKKGKWHQRFYSKVEMMVCSECGNEFSYDAETGLRDYNFCPNCGADMREDEQE